MFENYKDCLFNGEIILKSQQRLKRDHHKVYTEEVNKIALSCDDDKRLQTFNRVATYPYGTPTVKVSENEIMVVRDPEAFIEYSNDMGDVYKNINYENPDKKNKILIVFDEIVADMIHNKKLDSIVTELLLRGRKLNISLAFITQSSFNVPKDVRLNTTHFFFGKNSK